ncbi:unnamed protein product, partial [Ixodes persulcatus]
TQEDFAAGNAPQHLRTQRRRRSRGRPSRCETRPQRARSYPADNV